MRKVLVFLSLVFITGCRLSDPHGTLRFHVSSLTFPTADNIYYETDQGNVNTGPISLPFDFSGYVNGEEIHGESDHSAELVVTILASNNTAGGDLTTEASFVDVSGEKFDGGKPPLTQVYNAGVAINQEMATIVSAPAF